MKETMVYHSIGLGMAVITGLACKALGVPFWGFCIIILGIGVGYETAHNKYLEMQRERAARRQALEDPMRDDQEKQEA